MKPYILRTWSYSEFRVYMRIYKLTSGKNNFKSQTSRLRFMCNVVELHGILSSRYTRKDVILMPIKLLNIEDMNTSKIITLREAAQKTINGGQGFLKCNCKSGKCQGRCACYKANLLCNSRCHHSLSCDNK